MNCYHLTGFAGFTLTADFGPSLTPVFRPPFTGVFDVPLTGLPFLGVQTRLLITMRSFASLHFLVITDPLQFLIPNQHFLLGLLTFLTDTIFPTLVEKHVFDSRPDEQVLFTTVLGNLHRGRRLRPGLRQGRIRGRLNTPPGKVWAYIYISIYEQWKQSTLGYSHLEMRCS